MQRTLSTYVTLKRGITEFPPVLSVSIPGAKSVPEGRFVGTFGIRGTLNFFKEVRRGAPSDVAVHRIDVRVEINDGTNPMVISDRLSLSTAMHMDKLSVDLRNRVRALLKVSEPMTLSQAVAYDPALLNILWAEPDFQHFKVICWSHPTRTNPKFQLGALASPDVVSGIEIQNYSSPVEPVLQFF